MDIEKRADNDIISTKKEQIKQIEIDVDNNKKVLNSLDDIEYNFRSLKRNIDKCVELLNHSIKGDSVQKRLSIISEENVNTFNSSMKGIYEKRDDVNKKIKELYNEKDKANDEIKNIYSEKMIKEKESRGEY